MIVPMIQTERLDLVPATLEHLQCELQNPKELESLLGVSIPDDWPPGEYDRDALEYFCSKLYQEGSASIGWYVWYAVTRNTDGDRENLIAGAGYFGPPNKGSVEIGYSVLASARCHGFATEIVTALTDHAFKFSTVSAVIAHTSDLNPASTKVLLRCGFQRVGAGSEPGTIQYRKQRPQCA